MPTNGNHVVLFSSPCCDIAVPPTHPAASFVNNSNGNNNNNNGGMVHRPRIVIKNFLFLCLIAFSCFLYIFAIRLVMVSHQEGYHHSSGTFPQSTRDRDRTEYRSSETGFASLLRGSFDAIASGSVSSENQMNKISMVATPAKSKYDDDLSIEEIESTHHHPHPHSPSSPVQKNTASNVNDNAKHITLGVTSETVSEVAARAAANLAMVKKKMNNEPKDFMGIDDKFAESSGEVVVSKKQLEKYLLNTETTSKKVEEGESSDHNSNNNNKASITPVAVIQDFIIPKKTIPAAANVVPVTQSTPEENKEQLDPIPDDQISQSHNREDAFLDPSFQDSEEIELIESDVSIQEPFGIPIPQQKFQDIFHSRDLLLGKFC
jgi:hypothetical protein